MKVLSFDVASRTGWAFASPKLGIEDGGSFSCKSMKEAHDKFAELCDLWKPTIVISAAPVRFYNTIVKLSRIYGVLMYVCEVRGIKMYYEKGKLVNDATIKKQIMGSGKATKQEIMAKYNCDDEDQADACLFAEFVIMKSKEK